eukprot:2536213-Pleurochrysis_carterae.AAC.6
MALADKRQAKDFTQRCMKAHKQSYRYRRKDEQSFTLVGCIVIKPCAHYELARATFVAGPKHTL